LDARQISNCSFLADAGIRRSPGSRRQLGIGAVVIYAAEFFRTLCPTSDGSIANGIDTTMAVP
jgi:hypothetical protein